MLKRGLIINDEIPSGKYEILDYERSGVSKYSEEGPRSMSSASKMGSDPLAKWSRLRVFYGLSLKFETCLKIRSRRWTQIGSKVYFLLLPLL